MKENQLISVIIITYNSENYILETLKSVYNQSYDNIEIILSDDFSSDKTVELAEKWLLENGNRFSSSKIVTSPSNFGVASNCNRGIQVATGNWFKLCAGDDLLLKNCLRDNMNFVSQNPNTKMVVSNSISFLDGFEDEVYEITKPTNFEVWTEETSSKEQYTQLLIKYLENTTSFFLNREVFTNIKYDENFPFLEDYPFALNAVKAGYKFIYFDCETVKYRIRQDSISKPNSDVLYNNFFLKIRKFDLTYRLPYLPNRKRKMENFEYARKLLLVKYKLNRNNAICRIINSVSIRLNPYRFF